MKTSDIYPVSDFNRKPQEHIKRLQETGRPEVLTVNGKAAVVMIAPETYDALVQSAGQVQALNAINTANDEYQAGNTVLAEDFFSSVRAHLNKQ